MSSPHCMSGPQHFETAELQLARAADLAEAEELDENEAAALDYLVASAAVHAQLAAAAATVLPRLTSDEAEEWRALLAGVVPTRR